MVGFAAETNDVAAHARQKLASKGVDLIVANDVTAQGAGFDGETNVVSLFARDGRETALPQMSKFEVALRVLDEAVAAMKEDATLRLEIEGHTCNIGTNEYNLALGERRAHAVRDYLTSRGVTADRLRTVSYGEERPKHDNSREETRRLNRRAALTVRLGQ